MAAMAAPASVQAVMMPSTSCEQTAISRSRVSLVSSLSSSSSQILLLKTQNKGLRQVYHIQRRFRIGAAATSSSGDGFDRLAEEARRKFGGAARTVADKAEDFFSDVKQKAQEFQDENDLQGKARRFTRTANSKVEELGFEFKRNAGKWNRKYRFTQMGHEFVEYVKEQIQAADSQLRIRQRARTLSLDFRRKWPTYRRQLVNFLETPLGKLTSTIFFIWFVVSGWIFRVFVLSMWVLPFAAPLLLGTIARNAIVEGACPNCKTQFIGSRGQVVICRSCRNVVWQPRDDFSKGSEDPSIIDIDVDKD